MRSCWDERPSRAVRRRYRGHTGSRRIDAVTWITGWTPTGTVPTSGSAVSLTMQDEQRRPERETEADVMSGAVPTAVDVPTDVDVTTAVDVPTAVDVTDAVLDDATLVARARDGDLRAFEQLVRRYQRRIYQLALRMTASSADAEDVTQEVFLTARRRLPELREDAAVVGWLYRTATNRCLNLLRSRKPTSEIDESAVSSDRPADDPLRGAENSAQRRADRGPGRAPAHATRGVAPARDARPFLRRDRRARRHHPGRGARAAGPCAGTTCREDDAVAVNKLGEKRVEGHPLPCGRLVEDVFDDLEAGRADEHSRTCPHCATARRGLTTLTEATRALIDDPSEPSPNLLDRIMQAVRAEGRRGAALPLVPTDDNGAATTPVLGPVDVSHQAVAAVVRYAADTVEGVRARSCHVVVDLADPLALRIEMTVALRYGAGPVEAVVDTVRARIGSALRGQVGVRAAVVDVHVSDVWPGE